MKLFMLSKEEILEETFSEKTYQKGAKLYRGNQVSPLRIEAGEEVAVFATVKGTRNYDVQLSLDGKNQQHSYFCSCPAFETYMGACKHIVAVLLKYNEKAENLNQSANSGVSEKEEYRAANYLLNQMSDYFDSRTGYSGREKVNFEYQFAFESLDQPNESSLRLKVGLDRLYQVKDMEQDIRFLLEERPISFGKYFQYDPAEHYIAAKDREMLYQLLELKNYRYQSHYYYSPRNGNKSEMEIPAIFVKSFLPKVLKMDHPEVKLRHRSDRPEEVILKNPKFHSEGTSLLPMPLQLTRKKMGEEEEEQYLFSLADDSPEESVEIYPNQKIYIQGDEIYFLTDEEIRMIDVLGTVFQEQQDQPLVIPKRMIRDYMAQTIPSLQERFSIEIDEKIQEQFQKRPLEAKMFLDWLEDKLRIDVEFHYGDQKYKPLSLQAEDQEIPENLLLDLEEEGKILHAIYDFDFDFEAEDSSLILSDPEEIYRFLFDGLPVFTELLNIYTSGNLEYLLYTPQYQPKLVVDLDQKSNLLHVTFDMEGLEDQDLQGILQDLLQNKKYRRLTNGKLVNLQDRIFQEYYATMSQMDIPAKKAAREMEMPLHKVFSLEEETLKRAELKNPIKEFLKQLDTLEETAYPLPKSLQADLRPYQVEGYQWLKTLDQYGFGGVLADDMGLGKTVQSLAFIASAIEEQGQSETFHPVLVICPSSVLYNWQRESRQFTPDVGTILITGTKAEREASIEKACRERIPLWITSYPVLIRDADLYMDIHFRSVFLDEAQTVKNNTAKTTKAVRKLKSNNKFALSGTPLENQLGELYSIFSIIVPGLLGTQKAFKQMEMEQITRKIRPFLLRRLKRDVLKELPEKVESVEYIDLSEEQKALYLSQWKLIKNETHEFVESGTLNQNRIKILAGLTRLRQICCDPRLVSPSFKGESAKLERLLEYLETARENGNRVVLFSQFTQMLARIQEELQKTGRDYFYLDGNTPNEERLKLTSRFNEGEKDLFLISLRAGGTGLNLTGGDTVILYDSWWNPAVESQATDRVHRFGQKKMVQVIRMICTGTIEERINELQEQKRELIDQVITDGKQSLTSLTKEELLEILAD